MALIVSKSYTKQNLKKGKSDQKIKVVGTSQNQN